MYIAFNDQSFIENCSTSLLSCIIEKFDKMKGGDLLFLNDSIPG